MGLRVEDRTIGEFTYRVRQLGYAEGRAMLPIVLRAVGPTLGAMLEGSSLGPDGKLSLESNLDLSRALSEFSSSLSADDLAVVTDGMAGRSWILNAKQHKLAPDKNDEARLILVQENHWPSRYSDWLQWLAFALEVNFSSFLGGALNVGTAMSAVVKGASASASPSTSTGVSGGS